MIRLCHVVYVFLTQMLLSSLFSLDIVDILCVLFMLSSSQRLYVSYVRKQRNCNFLIF